MVHTVSTYETSYRQHSLYCTMHILKLYVLYCVLRNRVDIYVIVLLNVSLKLYPQGITCPAVDVHTRIYIWGLCL